MMGRVVLDDEVSCLGLSFKQGELSLGRVVFGPSLSLFW